MARTGFVRVGVDRGRLSTLDRHVAERVRERRIMLGMTQHDAAMAAGVTYQQFHKYETGVNRISAGRLYRIAEALRVTVAHFYQGLERGGSTEPEHQQRMLTDLAANFAKIPDARRKEAVVAVTRALAKPSASS